jgi:HlyD family secretion protein
MNIQNLPNPDEIEAVLGLDGRGRRRLWRKRAVWLALAAALIGAMAWWYAASGNQAAAIVYETQPVTRTEIIVTVTATGKIQPTTQVDVSSEMSGVVRTVNVDNNSLVKRGDVLAELDIERLNAQLDRAKATLTAAEARIADARATMAERDIALSRAQTLRKKGISAAQDLDTAKAAHDRAVAAINAAEADAAVARADLVLRETDIKKSRILSPVDGIVLKRSVEPGQTVASSLQAPVLFTLAGDLRRMQVEADVDEADIGSVKPGQKATFTVDAYPGRSFPAQIETIEYSPNVKENVVTYKAVLTVDNTELLLRPGMTATAEIVVQEVGDALAVPNAALRYKPPAAQQQQEGFSLTRLFIPRMPRLEPSKNEEVTGSDRKVWVLENSVPRETTIRVGASDGDITEVTGGDLSEGALAITSSKQANR